MVTTLSLRTQPYRTSLGTNKNEGASKNNTFKLNELKIFLKEPIASVTADAFKKFVTHVQKEEQKMSDLGTRVEVITEPLIIILTDNISNISSISNSGSDFSESE